MRFAYADPPYFGLAKAFYGDPTYDNIEAHVALVNRLVADFPDGWALSLTSNNLKDILPICPRNVRVMAWVKSFHSFKPGIAPAYAWEPLIVFGGRKPAERGNSRGRDWIACSMATGRGLRGAKPEGLCFWLFSTVLGMRHDDVFVDVFPGSGGVARAWDKWRTQLELLATA